MVGDRQAAGGRGSAATPRLLAAALCILIACTGGGPARAWDFSNTEIPVEQIEAGGPPRDGIPALFSPAMVSASEAGFLEEDEKVLGLEIEGDARAYPLRILSWHELVNDTVGGRAVLVSW